mmetsp:Transcript_51358/g.95532  ORF Transcript_51358/g.95532 Transcript_51358/m.95532 type:complete len:361 (-) Transcript_51358:419-1501(-)
MSSGSEDTEENESWIQWFCRMKGNEYFCEVDKSYIEDGFNLFGLRNLVPHFQESMEIILDRTDADLAQEESDRLTSGAMQLYGLIHARYITTTHGLNAMHQKFLSGDFGKCPRFLCHGQSVVPLGQHVDPDHFTVKVFCPKCSETYSPVLPSLGGVPQVDGAYFGPTFPHLFFMTFMDEMPKEPPPATVPRVYGFRVHASSAAAGPAQRLEYAQRQLQAQQQQPTHPSPVPLSIDHRGAAGSAGGGGGGKCGGSCANGDGGGGGGNLRGKSAHSAHLASTAVSPTTAASTSSSSSSSASSLPSSSSSSTAAAVSSASSSALASNGSGGGGGQPAVVIDSKEGRQQQPQSHTTKRMRPTQN